MKVLRVLSRMNVGGPSLHVLNLAAGLTKEGFETRLAVGEPQSIEGSMIPLALRMGIKPVIIPGLNRPIAPLQDLRAFCGIVSQIRSFRPDIVHTHTAKAGILGRLAAVICGVPLIVHTFHGNLFKGYFPPSISKGIVAFERFLSRFSDILITLSPRLREDLLKHLRLSKSNKKVAVIPLGLDLAQFLRTPRRLGKWRNTLNLPKEAILLGIVARLVPIKNHTGLLSTFSHMVKQDQRLHLAIIGGGEEETEIRKIICGLNLSDRVHLCGIIEAVEQIYSDLDLLVLVSHNEGTPVVLIEALAAGCPVAATNVGGVLDVLDGGSLGTLLPEEPFSRAQTLAKAVSSLVEQELASELNRAAIVARYRVEDLVRTISQCYKRTIAKRDRKGSENTLTDER